MRRLTLWFFFLLIVMLAAGCERTETVSPKKTETEPGREKTLLIGLIPEQNIFKEMERHEALGDYLSKKVNITIRMAVLPRYGNIIDNFVSTGMDAAFLESFTYALAHEKLGLEVLARPVDMDGTSTYHGLIFVRKDSGIKSIGEMAGKRLAFVDKATTAGYLFPLAYFKRHGKDYRKFLKKSYFTGTHEDAIFDVLDRSADIGSARNTVYEELEASDGRIKRELTILERSAHVPHNGLVVRKDLDGDLKKTLKGLLLAMHENPEGLACLKAFGAQRFVETSHSDYWPVYRYAQEIELSLAKYDYVNE